VTLAAGTRLDIENELNLNGQTMTVSGPGHLYINNMINAGANGVVNSTGHIGGRGRINGALNATGGSVNPGNGVGTLTVDNGYVQNASTTLNIELAGTTVGTFDRLAVTGNAILSGTVDISKLGTFSDLSWDIVTATGSLTNNATIAAGDNYMLSVVGGNTLRLTIGEPCFYCGDYNGDGEFSAADYVEYRNRKAAGATSILNEDPSASPGALDKQDYLVWKNAYAATHGSGSSILDSAGNVPEPGSFALLLSAAGLLLMRSGRGRTRKPDQLPEDSGPSDSSAADALRSADLGTFTYWA
jgi:hypothetical protein